ncbi:hypothetical protein [Desulfosarcina sp.]|uniref:hypothetical protein n=1 Tax=Desulfosarcina sp. TaxID=2027861 RepID=UPI00397090AC
MRMLSWQWMPWGQAQQLFITLSANQLLLSHRVHGKVNAFLWILMDLMMVSVCRGESVQRIVQRPGIV